MRSRSCSRPADRSRPPSVEALEEWGVDLEDDTGRRITCGGWRVPSG